MTNETKAVAARKRVRRDFKKLNESVATYCRVSIRVLAGMKKDPMLDSQENGKSAAPLDEHIVLSFIIEAKIHAFREVLAEMGESE